MDIKDYVSQVLTQINEGIIDAQEKTYDSGCWINPPIETNPQGYLRVGGDNLAPSHVQFSIAVTVEHSKDQSGSGKLSVLSLSIGGDTSSCNKNINISTVSFPIYVLWASKNKKLAGDK